MHILRNIVLFQLGWFACILGAAYGFPLLGTSLALAVVAIHLHFTRQMQEAYLVLIAGVLGLVVDTILITGGWMMFRAGVVLDPFPPYWMVALWLLFATTLNHSLAWLKSRRLMAAFLGFIGGPLAYYAGAKLGAAEISFPESLLAIGTAWAIAMPLLASIADRLQRRASNYNNRIRGTQYV